MKTVFITGGTGYVGKRLISALLEQGHHVKALVRKGSEDKLPKGCDLILGDALDSDTYKEYVKGFDTFIHLVGVAHPGPNKKEQFKTIDLKSAKEAVKAATYAGVTHFIMMSVAQTPTTVMRDYQIARKQAEELILISGMKYTFVRPWYIIGPGHYWPLIFLPLFKLMEIIPSFSVKAKKLRLVYLKQIVRSFLSAVENKLQRNRIIEIEEIRKF